MQSSERRLLGWLFGEGVRPQMQGCHGGSQLACDWSGMLLFCLSLSFILCIVLLARTPSLSLSLSSSHFRGVLLPLSPPLSRSLCLSSFLPSGESPLSLSLYLSPSLSARGFSGHLPCTLCNTFTQTRARSTMQRFWHLGRALSR